MEDAEFSKKPTIAEIRWKYAPSGNSFIVHREKLYVLDKAALWITTGVGSMGFFFINFGWTFVWLIWNTEFTVETF